jgi:uncharacterized hydrophobic protein (TIGR00271 family)
MLHVRVVSPPGATEELIEKLAADPGIRNLILLPGAARHPDGDAVQFDLLDQSANRVLQRLRTQLGSDGSVAIEYVDVSITATAAPGAPAGRPGLADVPPVWDIVEAKIRADGQYPLSFFTLLVIAGLIGAVGILTNSQILIVAAMVVGPEYGAIMATALGIDKRDRGAVRRGLIALVAGFAIAVLAAAIFGLLIRWSGHTPRLYEAGVRPVSDLINSPNVFSVIVAVLAGIVGVVSLTESRANALIGVFISVATIPAASDMGLSAAYGSWSEARGSTFQLLLNVVLLIAVGAAGLRLQRTVWRSRTERAAAHAGRPAPPPTG